MGNMLVQGSSSILPPMNTQHWSRSMKLLVSTLRRSTKRAHGSNRDTSAADQAAPKGRRGPRSNSNRRAVRVKVVLTRAEAAQLLSLTAHGHRTAAQVVGELKRMQVSGATKASTAQVISELKRMEELVVARAYTSAPPSMATAWRPVLESIPEE